MEIIVIFDTIGGGKRAIGTATNIYNAIAALYDSGYFDGALTKGNREENILYIHDSYTSNHEFIKNFTFEKFYLWGSGEKTE